MLINNKSLISVTKSLTEDDNNKLNKAKEITNMISSLTDTTYSLRLDNTNLNLIHNEEIVSSVDLRSLVNGDIEYFGEIILSNDIFELKENETIILKIKLDNAPTNNEIISLETNNTNCSIDKTEIIFTKENYNIEQEVTITGVHKDTKYNDSESIITLANPNIATKTVTVVIKNIDIEPSLDLNFNMAKIEMTGDVTDISADNAVPTTFKMTLSDGTVLIDGFAKIDWQGDSSLNFPKKNYSIDLFSDEECTTKLKYKFFNDVKENNGYHLKANYIDATHARNICVVNEIKSTYKETLPSGGRGVIDGFPIIVYLNNKKLGLYTFNLKQHKTVYGLDGTNPNHLMYRAADYSKACRFLELSTDNTPDTSTDWEDRFPKTNTEENRAKLNRVIQWILDCRTSSDPTPVDKFRNEVEQYFNLNYLLDYYIYANMIGATDSMVKNLNMVTFDGNIWYTTFYDKDMVLGISDWRATAVISPTINFNDQTNSSALWTLLTKSFPNEIRMRYKELSFDNLKDRIIAFMDIIPQEEYDNDLIINPGIPIALYGDMTPREYIIDFINKRKEFINTSGETSLCNKPYPEIIEEGCEEFILNGYILSNSSSLYLSKTYDEFYHFQCKLDTMKYYINYISAIDNPEWSFALDNSGYLCNNIYFNYYANYTYLNIFIEKTKLNNIGTNDSLISYFSENPLKIILKYSVLANTITSIDSIDIDGTIENTFTFTIKLDSAPNITEYIQILSNSMYCKPNKSQITFNANNYNIEQEITVNTTIDANNKYDRTVLLKIGNNDIGYKNIKINMNYQNNVSFDDERIYSENDIANTIAYYDLLNPNNNNINKNEITDINGNNKIIISNMDFTDNISSVISGWTARGLILNKSSSKIIMDYFNNNAKTLEVNFNAINWSLKVSLIVLKLLDDNNTEYILNIFNYSSILFYLYQLDETTVVTSGQAVKSENVLFTNNEDSYHSFALSIDGSNITWYLDGIKYNTTNIGKNIISFKIYNGKYKNTSPLKSIKIYDYVLNEEKALNNYNIFKETL